MVNSDNELIEIHRSFLESDFIDVPTITKSSEPILLPSDDDSADIIETSNNNNNTSSEFIELDHDESSHNSTAIEDIRMFIANEKDQPLTTDVELKDLSFSQIVRRKRDLKTKFHYL